ncbi:Putative dimethyl sulfoxide reductase chaperone [uncultured archaeon]|nr:Putative dimethyl sulfoxide reductase chaperone [uncultured archaeon]
MSQSSVPCVEPAIRSNVYKLLSQGFRYPTPETFKTFRNGEFLAELLANIIALPYKKNPVEYAPQIEVVQDGLAGITFNDFEAEFVRTFDTGAPLPPSPPYEGFYREEPRTAVLLAVSEFYRHFGLIMSREEGKREHPDHLCAELEFLHFLAFKEAQAITDENPELLKGYRLAQKDFLGRHLVRWAPKFHDRLQSSARFPFYTELSRLTSVFLAQDMELVTANLEKEQ